MKGGIYTSEKCKICGQNLKDNGFDGLVCKDHPDQRASHFRVHFKQTKRRLKDYDRAWKFLSALRRDVDDDKYDPRDYRRENPLGFANLAEQWLEFKKVTVSNNHYRDLRNNMYKAIDLWGDRNVKGIEYSHLEDFLFPRKEGDPLHGLSAKTRANVKSTLHSFWQWLRRRRILSLAQMPEFPEISFELSYRNTVDKATQVAILHEVNRLTYDLNPRIWLGAKWLCTYVNVRPWELINIKEAHIDLDQARVLIPHPKERTPKFVFLIEEDVLILRAMPRGFPEMYFFRHFKGNGGAKPGQRFGKDYLYKWWRKACDNLGIEGVCLYGGTRHSSVIDLRKRHSPEAIKRAAGSRTNKAFDRYLQITADEIRPIYADTRGGKESGKDQSHIGRQKVK